MKDKEELQQELNKITGVIHIYEKKRSFSKTNDITYKNNCLYCRKAYIEQLLCDHVLSDAGRYNIDICKKCTYDTDRSNNTCFSENRNKHLFIEDAQITDECIVCGMNEKHHTEGFPCKTFPKIKI